MSVSVLDEVLARLKQMPAKERAELEKLAEDDIKSRLWVPTPGPQLDACLSKADILLYGGQAGGGKTDLVVGLALTEHRKSLILRKEYTDLTAITERAVDMNRTRKGFNGSAPPKLRTKDGRLIEFGAANQIGKEEGFQGQPHDLLAFDEAVQFAESQVRFLWAWVRSTTEGQRTRIILASNPPVGTQGAWIIPMFAPWLDPTHPRPAKPGELRWFVSDEEGHDLEVDGPAPFEINGKMVRPMSRTFIPAKLSDNPFLSKTDYGAKLDSMQEPYRSALRDGNFMLARKDAFGQLIPTAWVRAAMDRWQPQPPEGIPMCAIGVDVAMGGDDQFVIAPRHDGWFAKLTVVPGVEVKTGRDGAGHIFAVRRDKAHVIIDMGGGYGTAVYEHLKNNEFENLHAYKGAEGSTARTSDGQLGFFNKRSEVLWRFREALDPSQPGGSPIALYPDPELISDLTAPTFEVTARGIKAETKEDVMEKLKRSPDKGDAVCIAWSEGDKALTHAALWIKGANRSNYGKQNVNRNHSRARDFLRR